ncbi:hypothetical protein D3C79_900690 [compost metagenome]
MLSRVHSRDDAVCLVQGERLDLFSASLGQLYRLCRVAQYQSVTHGGFEDGRQLHQCVALDRR